MSPIATPGRRGPACYAHRMSAHPEARMGMSPAVVVVLLTLLLGIQPVATDLYLPALPTLQHELGAGVAAAQLTLSALIIAFGVAQLVAGPLADRFGRRPVLLLGMALYTVACAGAALAPGIEALIGWRALQGVAIATAVTCGRSIVRDLYQPFEGAKVMSRALSGLALIAMLSPAIGGLLVQLFGWRAPLAAPAVLGVMILAFFALKFNETVPERNPRATQLAPLLHNWATVLANPAFRAWAVLLCCTYGGLFLFLAGSSVVLIEQRGTPRLVYGLLLSSNSIAYLAGTFWCRRLLARHGMRGAVRHAVWFTLAGGLSMAALDLGGVRSIWAVLVPQWLFSIGHGVHQPCGQAGAVGPFPEKAGTAASVTGFVMMAVAFGGGLMLGRTLHGVSLPMTGGIAVFSVGVALVGWTLVQRHGDPHAAPAGVAAPART
jgi:MFS transporter, DHA1 family, multidrug resistance protein